MKTIVQILFICLIFVAKMYAQTTEITLHVLENKDKTWQGIKLQDKRNSKLSLASKLLKANKDGELQAYCYDTKNNANLVAIKYSQVAKNMKLPMDIEEEQAIQPLQKPEEGRKNKAQNLDFVVDSTPNYFLKDIKGANLITIKNEKYLSLILLANLRLDQKNFTIVMYKILDIEKVLKYKILWNYTTCETCNFANDENTDKEFVANPSMPEFEYRETKKD